MSAGSVRQGGVFIEIGADPKKFFSAMSRVNARIKALGTDLRSFGTQIAAASAGMAIPMGLALKSFASFDDAIRAVQAVTGSFGASGAAAFAALTQTARELGATTSFTATEVAALMTELGRAGFDPSQINAMTGAVLDLSRATGTDAALSAQILASSIRQFNLSAGDATRVADVLTTTANATNNTVEGLGEALKYAGVSASQAGLSIEETLAILGALGNVGLQGSSAGNVLKRLVTMSAAEAAKLEGIFGVKFVEDDGSARNFIDIFRDLAAATANLPSAERITKFNEAFGLLGVTGAQAIGGAIGDIDSLIQRLENANGAANKTAVAMDAGIGGSFRKALSAIEGVVLSIGESLAPAFKKVVDGITTLAGGIQQFIQQNSQLVSTVAIVSASVLAGGIAFVGLGAALQAVAFAGSAFLAVFASIGTIFAGVISAVTAAFGAVSLLFGALVAAGPVAGIFAIGAAIAGVGVAADAIGKNLGSSWTAALNGASEVFNEIYRITSETMSGIFDAVANGNLGAAAEILWAGLQVGWLTGQAAIMGSVDQWVSFLQNTFDFLGVELYASWVSLWSSLSQSANTLGSVLLGIMDNFLNGIAASWDWLEHKIRRHWILITGLLQGGKDVSKELQALNDEMAGRAARRGEDAPGIGQRMADAEASNQQTAAKAQQDIDAARADANARADARNQRNKDNAAGRQAGIDVANARIGALSNQQQSIRDERSLADQLISQLSETTDIDEFNTLIKMIEQLIAQGNLTDQQQQRFTTAVNTGADNIATAQEKEGEKASAKDKKLKEGAMAAESAGTQGTFSTAAAALTLGGGTSIAERTAKACEDTARNTKKQAERTALVAP